MKDECIVSISGGLMIERFHLSCFNTMEGESLFYLLKSKVDLEQASNCGVTVIENKDTHFHLYACSPFLARARNTLDTI